METLICLFTLLSSWFFAFEQSDHQMPSASSAWQSVTVPHDWAIYGPFSRDNDLQNVTVWQNGNTFPSLKTGRTGGLPYMRAAWYKTTISIPQLDTPQRFTLLFDGAMSEAEVYLNDSLVGTWPYGYNAFSFDISSYLHSGNNLLAVRLQNREQSSRWYPGAGLYRHVHLLSSSAIHIPVWGTYITTPYVSDSMASIRLLTRLEGAQGHQIKLQTLILSPAQTVVDTLSSSCLVRHSLPLEQNFTISRPQLWAPESPSLYTARTYVYADGVLCDSSDTHFGIRSIAIVPNVGFMLNGKVRKFQGVCLHHDLGPLGSAVYTDAIRRQLLLLREMGCDAVRTSHNMPAPELVSLCDSLGLMLMLEPFDEWDWAKCKNGYHRFFSEWAERDMVNMIHQFRNHPSVVMYSVGNEVPTQCAPEGYRVAQYLQDICRREDPTRPCTAGMDKVSCVLENGFASILDVVGLNYRAYRYQEAYQQTPQRLILGSETASTLSSRGVYLLPAVPDNTDAICDYRPSVASPSSLQCSSYDLQFCRWSNLPEEDFRNMEDYPWTIGQFVWTGFDYLGEPTPYDTDAWPAHSSYFGIIDLAGIPKDRYWLYRSQWRHDVPTVHLLPHWNWSVGDTLPVMVYTDATEGELFLNGKSLGKAYKYTPSQADSAALGGDPLALQRRYRLIWDSVPYAPGHLYVQTPSGIDERFTAGSPHHIVLREENLPGNSQLHFIRVSICDANGYLCPTASHLLRFRTRGKGRFLAAANGDPTCLDPFHLPQHHAFSGELTVILQGDCELRVEAEGLLPATKKCTFSCKIFAQSKKK